MTPTNDHNVYVLGAGFSAHAGLPLIPGFLERMRDCYAWLTQKNRDDEAKAIAEVLRFRLESAAAAYWVQMDLENIEELFSLASAQGGSMGNHIRLAIAATLDFARNDSPDQLKRVQIKPKGRMTLLESWGEKVPKTADEFLIDPYRFRIGALLGMPTSSKPVGKNTFITFNYDTILEENLKALGVPFSYGFAKDDAKFKLGADGDESGTRVTVLKIHGSVNWARSSDRTTTLVYPSYAALRKAGRIPQLIAPTWKKSYQRQFSTVMEVAAKHLETATRINVIGFSMPTTDVHFKYLLAAGLAQNISLRGIRFINPQAEELKARAEANFKAQYIQDKRIDFLAHSLASMTDDGGLMAAIGRPLPNTTDYTFR